MNYELGKLDATVAAALDTLARTSARIQQGEQLTFNDGIRAGCASNVNTAVQVLINTCGAFDNLPA